MTTYRYNNRQVGPIGDGFFQKYPGEHHFPGYSYLGPGSRLDIRLDENLRPKQGEEVKNSLDAIALNHDINYKLIQDEYKKDHNKQKALSKVHQADKEFIQEAKNSSVQPLGKISAGLIAGKMAAEKANIIDSKTFSGLGVSFKTKDGKIVQFNKKEKKHDPTEKLKKLAFGAGIKKRKHCGGFLPLVPLAGAVVSGIAGSLAGKIFDIIKKKISGGGYKIDDRIFNNENAKRMFIKKLLI